jgi:hypothetical protein
MSKGCALAGGDGRPVAALDDPSAFPSFSRVAFGIAHVFGVPLGDVFQYPDHQGVTK